MVERLGPERPAAHHERSTEFSLHLFDARLEPAGTKISTPALAENPLAVALRVIRIGAPPPLWL